MIQVSPTTAPVRRGECYVRVTLLMAGFAVGRLIAGYVTDGATLAWPGGKFEDFTDGAGLIRMITGTNPAAGAQVTEVVPTNARWVVRAIHLTFYTDATVANRIVLLKFDDGTTVFGIIPGAINQTATLMYKYTYFSGAPRASDTPAGQALNCLPTNMVLFQGYRFITEVYGGVAGDDFDAPIYQVEEWIEE